MVPDEESVTDSGASRPDTEQERCLVTVGAQDGSEDPSRCDVKQGSVITFSYGDPTAAAVKEVVMPAPTKTAASPLPDVPAADKVSQPSVEEAALPAPADEQEAGMLSEGTETPPSSPTAGELGDLIGAAGGGAVGLIAAVIAVVGGTAAFKLWTNIANNRHEQAMKKLDIEHANAGLGGAQPPPCQTAHQALVADIKALQAKVADLEGRAAKVEKATAGFNPAVDVDDLDDRVTALEKSFRRKARGDGGN